MLVFDQIIPLQAYLEGLKLESQAVAFVPTMGALHEGHISLINIAKKKCDVVVASVFVNPRQFNSSVDFLTYPRSLDIDMEKLEAAACHVAFIPATDTIYPKTYKAPIVNIDGFAKPMEGAHRPGHFEGMMQVVQRLLEIVKPDKAFFGEKDFQQLVIIKEMVKTLGMDIEIIGCPIIREESGLARSSRNELLENNDRERATILYRLLSKSKSMVATQSPQEIISIIRSEFEDEQLNIDYFEIRNESDLTETTHWDGKNPCRAFLAAYFGKIRLIDNLRLLP